VAITHIAVLGAALLALLCLPCAVAVLVGGDQVAVRRAWVRQARANAPVLRQLDRRLSGEMILPPPRLPVCIEQIAADLRRLDKQRQVGPTMCSELWQAAIVRAYDERLHLASECLGVTERLRELEGAARDSERLRVEIELESAGLSLRSWS
jgi:hypothetical protein